IRLKPGDGGRTVPLKLSIDRRMYAANIVDFVGKVLLGEDLLHQVTPVVRSRVVGVIKKIAIDQRNRVEKLGGTTISDQLLPVGRMPAVARHRNPELLADVAGKILGVSREDGLAKQCADAVPRSTAVRRRGFGPHIKGAESLPGHGGNSVVWRVARVGLP